MLQVLEGAAITLVVVYGSIFAPIRNRGPKLWQDLLGCPLCLGWWVGAVRALVFDRGLEPVTALVWHVFSAGALTGCVALLGMRVLDLIEGTTEICDGKIRATRALEAAAMVFSKEISRYFPSIAQHIPGAPEPKEPN